MGEHATVRASYSQTTYSWLLIDSLVKDFTTLPEAIKVRTRVGEEVLSYTRL